jgi:hypothetical protein
LPAFGLDFGAEGGEAVGVMADVVESLDFRLLDARLRVRDQIGDEAV